MGQWTVKIWLLNKRVFKRPIFWLILCLVPALSAGMRLAQREESGVAGIAIYQENSDDALSRKVIERLTRDKTVLRYTLCRSEEEARRLVKGGQADAALLFPENLQTAIERSAAAKSVEPVVTMVVREKSVPMIFAGEVLCGVLYPYYSYEVYADYVRNDSGLKDLSDSELREIYSETELKEELFRILLLDGTEMENTGYLLMPVRGMLALWLMLCGLAGSLYFMQDERNGTFDNLPMRQRSRMASASQAVLLADGAAVLLAALALGGLFTSWQTELLGAMLFACCVAAFSDLLRLLCRTPERLGVSIPVLLLLMLVFSPVFIHITGWKPLKLLLPTCYYLAGVHDRRCLWGMAVYAVAVAGMCRVINEWRIRRRCRKRYF